MKGTGFSPYIKPLTIFGNQSARRQPRKGYAQQNRAVLGLNIWLDNGEPGNYQTEQIMQNGKFLIAA